MTKNEALRLALEAFEYTGLKWPQVEQAITAIKAALEANEFNPDWDTQAVLTEEIQRMAKRIEELEAKGEPDWKDMYEKQKRRSEMWIAKYEKDIKPLEKAVPHQEAKDESWVCECGADSYNACKCVFKAHPQQEAKNVPWEQFCDSHCVWTDHHPDCNLAERKPLTDEQMKKIWYDMNNIMGWYSFQEIARAIEAAHGIKGEA